MPRFIVTRNWIEMIGPIWWPAGAMCAQRKDLSDYDLDNMRDDEGQITRESVERWLCLNSGDFQHVADFAAYITADDGEHVFPWADEESEFTYLDCMSPTED